MILKRQLKKLAPVNNLSLKYGGCKNKWFLKADGWVVPSEPHPYQLQPTVSVGSVPIGLACGGSAVTAPSDIVKSACVFARGLRAAKLASPLVANCRETQTLVSIAAAIM